MGDNRLKPVVMATSYRVSCIPDTNDKEGVRQFSSFDVTLEYRRSAWVALVDGAYLALDGSRSRGHNWRGGQEAVTDEEFADHAASYDAWVAAHYFDFETACRLAVEVAPTLKNFRGHGVAEALAWLKENS